MRKFFATITNAAMIYFLLFAALIAVSNVGFFGFMGVFAIYAACLVFRCYYTKVGFDIEKFQSFIACNAIIFLAVKEVFTKNVIVQENWLRSGNILEAFALATNEFIWVIPVYLAILVVVRTVEYMHDVWLYGDKSNLWSSCKKWETIAFCVLIAWVSFLTIVKVFILALS